MFDQLSPPTRTVLRVSAGIAIAIAAGFATMVLLFVGAVTATGCFIECNEPNVVGGSLLLAGAVACASLAVSAVVWGAIGWQRRILVRVASWVAAVSTLAVMVIIAVV